jgi:hypothetical protein
MYIVHKVNCRVIRRNVRLRIRSRVIVASRDLLYVKLSNPDSEEGKGIRGFKCKDDFSFGSSANGPFIGLVL